MRDPRPLTTVLAAGLLLATLEALTPAQTADPDPVLWRIRQEATEHSSVMDTLHILTDRFGPRLTGSPNFKAAADWAVAELTRWGLANVHLEPWDFKHAGWLNERFSGHIVAPVTDHLVGEVLAWTPGTNGRVRASALLLTLPDHPTAAELDAHLARMTPAFERRVVLVGAPLPLSVSFNAPPKRLDENELRLRFEPGAAPPPGPPPPTPENGRLSPNEIDERINAALVAGNAAVRLNDAGRDHGQIRAFNNRTFDLAKAVPTVVLRHEDYGRIARLLGDGAVDLEFEIVNRVYPDGATSYNVVAEIPGGDNADDVVMLGGHLDSWHAATGATDNAVGVAVMMDAIRVLRALEVKPRRTIRLALWGGEEQGLLGSQAYVREHFGTFEEPKPAFASFAGYVNIDSGTGRARGATVFGPPEAAAMLREILLPFHDLGVVGAAATTSRRRGGSDHTSFNEAGLPGIAMLQDPIEYQTHSWHTNLDTYERIVPDDTVRSATTIAGVVYALAMADETLPRFDRDAMPKPPAPPPARPTQP